MSFLPNTPTGHDDVDLNLRDAHVFAKELQYVLELREGDPDFDLEYAHGLACRLLVKLDYLHEDLPLILRMVADGRLDPPEDEEEGGAHG